MPQSSFVILGFSFAKYPVSQKIPYQLLHALSMRFAVQDDELKGYDIYTLHASFSNLAS